MKVLIEVATNKILGFGLSNFLNEIVVGVKEVKECSCLSLPAPIKYCTWNPVTNEINVNTVTYQFDQDFIAAKIWKLTTLKSSGDIDLNIKLHRQLLFDCTMTNMEKQALIDEWNA